MPERVARPMGSAVVEIDDEFWSERTGTAIEMLEYQYEQLVETGTLENFRRAADGETGGFEGMWFQDSDVYKWLEAASYALEFTDDSALEDRVAEVVDLVASAQADDGYLNTYFQVEAPEGRWTNLHMMHELYCCGHLIEAAVVHHRVTGEESLLDVATAFVEHVDETFPEEVDGVPGHQGIELALVKLARETGEDRYLELAAYFVDRRGEDDRLAWELANLDEIYTDDVFERDPVNAPLEEISRSLWHGDDGSYDGRYGQAHEPIRDQTTVEGHSVRATYFFAGATDIAMETDDEELFEALEGLWRNMTQRRMYVTAGIGSEPDHEGFTEDYDLPNDSAYAETCAAIGSIFWSQRLFEATGDGRYHDLIERTLYNAMLVGMSLDGDAFFYQNLLESDGEFHRSGWFDCACCPPNIARLLTSLSEYLYAVDDDGIYVNQLIGSEASHAVDATDVHLSQESALPWDGTVALDVEAEAPVEFALRVRVPEWSDGASVTVDGDEVDPPVVDGYLELDRTWTDDRVEATFEMTTERLRAHPEVAADAGRVALTRGPLVYCLEATDLEAPIHQYAVPASGSLAPDEREGLLGGVTALEVDAVVPDREPWDDELYLPLERTDTEDRTVTAVPYYAWDNREPGAMRVWLPSA